MNWLVEKMKEDGSKNAIIFKGKEYTYEALVEQIEDYYIIISKQINRGEIVSIISDYSFQSIARHVPVLDVQGRPLLHPSKDNLTKS